MRLRGRLILASLALTLMLLGLVFGVDSFARQESNSTFLREVLSRALASADTRAACEADPEGFAHLFSKPPDLTEPFAATALPPPPPGAPPAGAPPRAWVYDSSGRPANAAASPLPTMSLEIGEIRALEAEVLGVSVGALARTTWTPGPCAWVLVLGSADPGKMGSILPIWAWPALPLLVALGTFAWVLGPVVGRLRALERQVRHTAEHAWTEPVAVAGSDEIGALAATFEAVRRALVERTAEREARERALRDYVADTTHDLALPTTVLKGHLAALAARGPDPDVQGAIEQVQWISALLGNLSASARLDAGLAAARPARLDRVVARVVERFGTLSRQDGVAVEWAVPEGEVWVLADELLLEQAAANLVHNAIRYNRRGGHAAVVLDVYAGRFSLAVLDDGPGVEDALLARLGERGLRGERARQVTSAGQGLGLNIVRRVTQQFGFTVTFARSPYGGLAATLEGPVVAAPSQPVAHGNAERSG